MLEAESMPSKPSSEPEWAAKTAWQLGRREALEEAIKMLGGLPAAAERYQGQ